MGIYIFRVSKNSFYNYLVFEKVLFYLISFLCMIVLLSYIFDLHIINSIKYATYKKFNHSLFHSNQTLLALCIPFILNYYFNNKNKMNLLFLFTIYLGTFASHGRTAIIVLAIGTIVYFIYDLILKKKFTFFNILIIFLVLIFSTFLVLYISGSTLSNLTIHTSSRIQGWLLYLNYIIDDNFIFGYGLQGTELIWENGELSFKHPHNIYIEALFGMGIVGFLSLVILTLVYIYNIIKLDEKKYNKIVPISFFFSLIILQQAIGSLWGGNSIVICLILAMISLNIKTPKFD